MALCIMSVQAAPAQEAALEKRLEDLVDNVGDALEDALDNVGDLFDDGADLDDLLDD